MVSLTTLDIRSYRQEAIPHTFLRQEGETDHAVLGQSHFRQKNG
jgi:hypothetical protein